MNTSEDTGAGREFPLVFRLIVLAVITLILLLVAEFGLRLFGPDIRAVRGLVEEVDGPRGFVLKANNTIHFEGLREPLPTPVTWVINEQRIRANHPVTPYPDRFRIAIYGDSEAFGWGVDFDDTFQHQMELRDPGVEVINLAVPGYNITNISAAIEQTATNFHPDLIIYLVHENDFDDPLQGGDVAANSSLLRLIKLAWYARVVKPREKELRSSADRMERFVQHVDHILQFTERNNLPLVLAFMEWSNSAGMNRHAVATRGAVPASWSQNQYGILPRQLNLNPVIVHEKKVDKHFTRGSYRKMADALCAAISGTHHDGCVPPGWRGHAGD